MRACRPVVAALLLAFIASVHATEKLGDLRGVSRASFNHDASRVVVRDDTAVTIWELPAGTPVTGDLDPKAESDGFLMSADGKLVAISFKDGRCRVFDSTTAKAISPPLDFRLNAAFQMPGLFSPDGNTLLLFGDKEAVAYEIRSGKKFATIPLAVAVSEEATGSAAFADGGSQCFVMNGAGVVTRYDTKTWKPTRATIRHPAAESAYDFGFNVSEDGKWLVTYDGPGENGPKGNLQAWDATTGKALGKPLAAVNGMAGRFVGNNRVLVLPGRGDATVRDLPSMNVAYRIDMHDDIQGPNAAVSADAKSILAWGPDQRLDLIDAATGKVTSNYPGPSGISKVIMAPDATSCYVVFEGRNDQSLVKLNLPELKLAETVPIPDFVLDVSVSRDGKRLMIQHGDPERLDLYDAGTLKPLE
jgi:WD40 repeat protein